MCSLLETSMAATCGENNVLESGNGKSSDNPAVSDESKTKAEELKEKANDFFKKEIYDKAIQFYSEAIDCNPNVAAYYGNRSLANLRLECFGDALSDANKALALDKTYIKAYYRRASANMALGKHKEALKDFRYVVTVRPNDKDASARYTECDRVVRRVAFERAIASDDSKAVSEQINIDAMMIEDDYLGPQLEDGKVTEKFVKDLMQTFKEQKGLHKKHAYKILLDIKKYFQSQPSLVRIEVKDGEKFTVCGDIHGQFYDLLNIFEINGLPSETNPYLFNGDFVDRGSFSVECIFTLFSFKLLYPNHFFMARGNHESENMNQMYGFEGEVRSKFSSQMIGLFTEVFNWLPLAHCINNKVLVMHGGLSKDHVSLDDITEVDRNRQPPESGIMCDLLWSDPQMLPGTSPSKRGVGVQFGPNVTSDFLAKNGLDYIIRSHEVKDKGYEVSHDGKCVTVFSAPNYCDTMGNQGAFITLTGGTDLKPQFTSYDAVPHPKVKPMAYASPLFGLF